MSVAGPSSSSRPAACSGDMYAGVPSAWPNTVADDSPPDRGCSVASPRARSPRIPADRFGQAPVDDQRLAVLAEHDVARLQVAVQDAAAVGVGDRVADVDEPPEQLPELAAQSKSCYGFARREWSS